MTRPTLIIQGDTASEMPPPSAAQPAWTLSSCAAKPTGSVAGYAVKAKLSGMRVRRGRGDFSRDQATATG